MSIEGYSTQRSQQKPDHKLIFFMRIFLVILVVVNIYPVLFTLFTSFKSTEDFYSNIWSLPQRLLLNNYVNAFKIGHIGEYFINSIAIEIITLLGTMFLGVLAAHALARLKVPFAKGIIAVLLIVQILPQESMIMPLYIFMSKLKFIGMIYLPIATAYIGWFLPGTIVILTSFFQTIPVELLESARIDGSSEINTMFKIIIPLSMGAITTCTVLNFCGAWGELMWAQIATLNSNIGMPLTVGLINFQGQYTTDWGLMTAAICMVLLPLFTMFIFLQKYFIQGLTSGAVKG